jgi:tetratricopeptide (TPR) repeat protein
VWNRQRRWGSLLLAILVGCAGADPPPVERPPDADASFDRYMEAGHRWERSGSPDAAALHFERAVSVARSMPQPDVRLAEARFELGDALRRQARFEDAQRELRESLDALEPLREQHPDLHARILDAIGYCQLASGDADAAAGTLALSLKLRVEQLDPEDAATAETLVNLAEAHHRIGEDEQALDLLVEATYIYTSLGEDYRIRLATVHDNMGRIYRGLGRFEESERLHRRAIELARRVREQDNPNVAIFERSLANLYMLTGHEAEAEVLYRDSLAILQRTLGSEHYETQASRTMLERNFPDEPES